jgi:NitT/TauT family transport system ATP-binding protein
MQQRVGIARAFAIEPDILIMDEPFASLDAQLREIMQEVLLALQQETACTVVLITHSLEEALVLSDRIIMLSSRPGTVLISEEVPFGRPRESSIRDTSTFAALRTRLWTHLRGQVVGQSASRTVAAPDG